MKKQYEHLIVNGIRWVDSLPDHEGSVGGKGFPILMNGGLVPEANAWVCPTMFQKAGSGHCGERNRGQGQSPHP